MKGLVALRKLQRGQYGTREQFNKQLSIIEKELKALEILIKWFQPYIIHDLCCFGASDEEIALVKEVLK